MRRLEHWILMSLLSGGLAIALVGISCQKAERVAKPPQAESSALQSSGEDAGGGESEGEVTFVELTDELVPDSVGVLPGSLVVWQGDDGGTPTVPEPKEFVLWLQSAYHKRNAAMVSAILADGYECTWITRCGQRSWGKDMEIRIHERMFNAGCEVKPIQDLHLQLGNATATPPPSDPDDLGGIWTVRCDVHIVFDYVNAEDGVWEFVGPAEFLIRVNPDSPCGWELVAWHDELPYSTE